MLDKALALWRFPFSLVDSPPLLARRPSSGNGRQGGMIGFSHLLVRPANPAAPSPFEDDPPQTD